MHLDRTVALTCLLNSLTSPSVRHVDTHLLCLLRLLSGWCGGTQWEPLVFKGHTWSECCLPSTSLWRSPAGEWRADMLAESLCSEYLGALLEICQLTCPSVLLTSGWFSWLRRAGFLLLWIDDFFFLNILIKWCTSVRSTGQRCLKQWVSSSYSGLFAHEC